MSTLRQKKKDSVPKEDAEAHMIHDGDDSAESPSSPMRTTASPLHHNPAGIARMVLRKVGHHLLINDKDAEDITTAGGIIALLKDILVGIILGCICVYVLVFLVHKNVIHMQSAHSYRNMAYEILSDPETRENIEESTGLVFRPVEDLHWRMTEIE